MPTTIIIKGFFSKNFITASMIQFSLQNISNESPFVKSDQGIIPQFRRALKDIAVPTKVTEPEGEVSWKSGTEEFDYSQLNWARDLGIITSKDVAIFERTINNEIFRGMKPQTADGEYIIDTGKCLMFTDGDFHNPTLSRVLVFSAEYESLIDEAKRRIREDAKNTGDTQISQRIIENIHGPGFVIEYTSPVYGANARKNRRRKGTNSPGGYQGYRAKSVRERLIEDGYAHLLDDGDTSNKLPVGTSSRVALVDALEGLARRDEEKRLLNTYRTYIKNAQADQERLVKTRKEIARLRKEGDPNKRIPKLQQAG